MIYNSDFDKKWQLLLFISLLWTSSLICVVSEVEFFGIIHKWCSYSSLFETHFIYWLHLMHTEILIKNHFMQLLGFFTSNFYYITWCFHFTVIVVQYSFCMSLLGNCSALSLSVAYCLLKFCLIDVFPFSYFLVYKFSSIWLFKLYYTPYMSNLFYKSCCFILKLIYYLELLVSWLVKEKVKWSIPIVLFLK